MPPSHSELIRLMGMNDTQWRDASYLHDLLSTLHDQRESNIDAPDRKDRPTGYFYAARSMFIYTFRTPIGPYHDEKRKSLWYLGWKGPKELEFPELNIRVIYHILQKSRYLYLYRRVVNPDGQGEKKVHRIARFDMQAPEQRQSFVDIRRLTEEKYPTPMSPQAPKHKDVLRVKRLECGGGEGRRERKTMKKKILQRVKPTVESENRISLGFLSPNSDSRLGIG
ncbi:hypothetical protein G7Y89_g7231 [Cudoniella acicularis]|uniref:Uncharacterized protein n=1 Tax=Cudoniella acicularis TaxID=354080 RepID=A0A8H4W298_9HELO|nr:hypothetical protein G7Y89_g7231 [Cudoniella acicularis]